MKALKITIVTFFIIGLALFGCKLDETVSSNKQQQKSKYQLFINEFMASNDSAYADEYGEYDDWIELYNAGDDTIALAGFYFSDDKNDPTKVQIPTTSKAKIAPKGFIILWADKQPEQGDLHLNIKLSSGGEDIVVTEPDGFTTVDEIAYEQQETDVSYGRVPDGGSKWQKLNPPTPGASNTVEEAQLPPKISNITISPDSVMADSLVTISAMVVDENEDLKTVELHYGLEKDSLNTTVAMSLQNNSTFSAQIGPFKDGTRVYFFISAEDAKQHTTTSDTLSFEVGYVAPVLFINEFMASNDSAYADENGEYDDWIEIYNPGSEAIDIGGMYITDDLSDLTAWKIPTTDPQKTTIPAGGFLVLWADKQPEQGVLHVNIKLKGSGEQIGLTAPNGTTVIDSLTYPEQTTDVSMGRLPDGSDHWEYFQTPTPGASNHK